jgi:hypothetical protein
MALMQAKESVRLQTAQSAENQGKEPQKNDQTGNRFEEK